MSRKTRTWLIWGACIGVLSISTLFVIGLVLDWFTAECSTQPATVRSLSWHPHGTLIAATGMYSVSLYSDTLQEKTPTEGFGLGSSGFAVGWSADGAFLATDAIAAGKIRSGIQIWNATPLSLFGRITPTNLQENLLFFSWSADGTKIAGDSETRVSIWNAKTLKLIRYLEDPTDSSSTNFVGSASWSPDSKRLATSDRAGFIHIWDVETGQKLSSFASPGGSGIPLVQWSPAEQHVIATGDMDGQVRLWDARSGVMIRASENDSSTFWISSLSWSNDGTRIAATNDTLRVWDTATGRLVVRLDGHQGFVEAVDWSPDNNRLVSAGSDGTIRIWDASTGKQLYSQQVPGEPIPVCPH